jgi:hypothetical protein
MEQLGLVAKTRRTMVGIVTVFIQQTFASKVMCAMQLLANALWLHRDKVIPKRIAKRPATKLRHHQRTCQYVSLYLQLYNSVKLVPIIARMIHNALFHIARMVCATALRVHNNPSAMNSAILTHRLFFRAFGVES